MTSVTIHRLRLKKHEERAVFDLARSLSGDGVVDLMPALKQVALAAQELPRRIREELRDFKTAASCHALCIAQSLDGEIPATPNQHRPPGGVETAHWFDMIHLMYAFLLGEPFAWSSIQNGYIINDVIPLSNRETEVASYGSAVPFDLHTEDAFHICAGEYLGLMCLRNTPAARTTFSTVETSDLSEASAALLHEPRYVIGANVAQEVDSAADGMPIFFGNVMHPYFRINLNNTTALPNDVEAAGALKELTSSLKRNTTPITFNAGECWFIDNYRVAHGREPFQPRYDGDDRWLRRLYITESLRRSAALRHWPEGRTINPFSNAGYTRT